MRFAMQDSRTLKLLPKGRGEPVAYFFHLRGKSMVQKSLKGMLCELLYQLLLQFPALYPALEQFHRQLVTKTRNVRPDWDIESLKAGLLSISQFAPPRGDRIRLVMFIDALDENHDQSDNEELLSFIRELAATVHGTSKLLKVCLASRPWPLFQKRLGEDRNIPKFAIHNFTQDDIRHYASSKLSLAFSEGDIDTSYERHLESWTRAVTNKAHGVFIWVRIVVDFLHRNIIDGTPYDKLQLYLDSLPDELKDLYEQTMRRIPPDYALETLVACRILLVSLSQITLRTLHCATTACINAFYEKTTHDRELSWLRSRTGGLVEIIEGEVGDGNSPVVQFIHQTAQEFVQNGMPGLSTSNIKPFWLNLDGNFLTSRAIATEHPPYEPLWDLAGDLFSYLEAVDELLDHDPSGRPLMKAIENSLDHGIMMGRLVDMERSSPLSLLYRSQIGVVYLADMLIYINPARRDSFRQSISKIRNMNIGNSNRLATRKAELLETVLSPAVVCAALIVHDIYHIRIPITWNTRGSPYLLLLSTLGERFSSGKRTDRPRMLQNLFDLDFYFQDLSKIPSMLQEVNPMLGRLHAIAAKIKDYNLLQILFIIEDHPWVSEDVRFRLVKLIMESGAMERSTLELAIRYRAGAGEEWGTISLMSFCARFKDPRWAQLVWSLGHRSTLPWPDYIAQTAAVGRHAETARDIYIESEEPSGSDRGVGYVIGGLMGGLIGCPELWKVCSNGCLLSGGLLDGYAWSGADSNGQN